MAYRIVLEGEWLSSSQAAARLGVTTSRFFALVKAGRLHFQEIAGRRVYPGVDIDRLRQELDTDPRSKAGSGKV